MAAAARRRGRAHRPGRRGHARPCAFVAIGARARLGRGVISGAAPASCGEAREAHGGAERGLGVLRALGGHLVARLASDRARRAGASVSGVGARRGPRVGALAVARAARAAAVAEVDAAVHVEGGLGDRRAGRVGLGVARRARPAVVVDGGERRGNRRTRASSLPTSTRPRAGCRRGRDTRPRNAWRPRRSARRGPRAPRAAPRRRSGSRARRRARRGPGWGGRPRTRSPSTTTLRARRGRGARRSWRRPSRSRGRAGGTRARPFHGTCRTRAARWAPRGRCCTAWRPARRTRSR